MNDYRILGADIGGTAVKFVLRDGEGEALLCEEIRTDPDDSAATLGRLAGRVTEAGFGPPSAVGIACAGIVDVVGGRLGRAPNLPGWQGSNLRTVAATFWPETPLALANDVNGALMGEVAEGSGRGARSIAMLALGTGVGGALMIDGRLVTGGRYGAGEFGHMVVDPNGPRCTCGSRGCLEAYASATALVNAARKRAAEPDCGRTLKAAAAADPAGPTPRVLAGLAREGDADALELYTLAGRMLGQAIGNLVNILDPDIVIIGGGVAGAGDLLLDPARETAASLILCEASRTTPVVVSELGPHAAAIGAAIMADDLLRATGRSGA